MNKYIKCYNCNKYIEIQRHAKSECLLASFKWKWKEGWDSDGRMEDEITGTWDFETNGRYNNITNYTNGSNYYTD